MKGYILDSYGARRLGLKMTGNAGGVYNILLNTHVPDLSALLKQMDTGLLVTEVIGQDVNLQLVITLKEWQDFGWKTALFSTQSKK